MAAASSTVTAANVARAYHDAYAIGYNAAIRAAAKTEAAARDADCIYKCNCSHDKNWKNFL